MPNASEDKDNKELGSPGFDNEGEAQEPSSGALNVAVTTRTAKATEKLLKRKEPITPTVPIPSYGNKKSKGFLSELTKTLNCN